MGKGNISVDKSMIKTVVDGKIIIPLPKVLVENRYYPMFSICSPTPVLHQLDQKIINPHYDFKHLTEKYFEIGMKLNDFSIQLVKYCTHCDDCGSKLHVNSHYTRFILSSYGTIARDVTYWFCPVCSTSPTGSENHLSPLRFQKFN